MLTNLYSRMGNLEGQLNTFMGNWEKQDALARESRRITHDRVELLSNQITRMSTDLDHVQTDVRELAERFTDDVDPLLRSHEGARNRRVGARGVWALVGAAVIAVGSAVAFVVDRGLTYLFPKP
jgi:hypothetical protein